MGLRLVACRACRRPLKAQQPRTSGRANKEGFSRQSHRYSPFELDSDEDNGQDTPHRPKKARIHFPPLPRIQFIHPDELESCPPSPSIMPPSSTRPPSTAARPPSSGRLPSSSVKPTLPSAGLSASARPPSSSTRPPSTSSRQPTSSMRPTPSPRSPIISPMSFPAIEPSTSHSSSSRSSSSSRTSLAQLTREKAASKGVSATEAKILETLEAILLQVERNSRMLTMLVSNKESLEEREDLPEEVDLPLPTYDSAKDLDQRLAENQTLKKSLNQCDETGGMKMPAKRQCGMQCPTISATALIWMDVGPSARKNSRMEEPRRPLQTLQVSRTVTLRH